MSDNIIQLNEDLIKHDLKDLVRSSVEETLNALLDKEADELVNAQKYERSSGRQGYRSGHYKRNFQTTAGEVELNVPKLKGVPFETAIIERIVSRFFRKFNFCHLAAGSQPAVISDSSSSSGLER